MRRACACCTGSQVFRGAVEAVNEAGGSADASRLEAWTLSAALLSRVLHRLFQLNAAYFEVSICVVQQCVFVLLFAMHAL